MSSVTEPDRETSTLLGKPSNSELSGRTKILLMGNTILVALIAGLCVTAYIDINGDLSAAWQYQQNPALARRVAIDSLMDMGQNFFLGSQNGSAAAFFVNMISADFASLASSVITFTNKAYTPFQKSSSNKVCWSPLTCPVSGEYVQCFNGNTVYCEQQGSQVNCAKWACINNQVASVISIVKSVARRFSGWNRPPIQNATAPPAFSDGFLRLDFITTFLSSQMRGSDWARAGKACVTFAAQVDAIDWTGNYTSGNQVTTFDINNNVHSVTEVLRQVCPTLTQIK